MKVFGITGGSEDDWMTLLASLLPDLTGRGLKVSAVSYEAREPAIDHPGKDSHRHREAGATEVLVVSARRWALVHETRTRRAPRLDELASHMTPVDLLVALGFDDDPHDKLEIYRAARGGPPRCLTDPRIVAVAADGDLFAPGPADRPVPVIDLDNVSAIGDFIVTHCRLGTA